MKASVKLDGWADEGHFKTACVRCSRAIGRAEGRGTALVTVTFNSEEQDKTVLVLCRECYDAELPKQRGGRGKLKLFNLTGPNGCYGKVYRVRNVYEARTLYRQDGYSEIEREDELTIPRHGELLLTLRTPDGEVRKYTVAHWVRAGAPGYVGDYLLTENP